MIKLSSPFLLSNLDQVPFDLVEEKKIQLEGAIFDLQYLKNEGSWEKIELNIDYLSRSYPGILHSLHFPTDNADYIKSINLQQYLYRFIELASSNRISILVLHSNCMQDTLNFKITDVKGARERFLSFLSDLDIFLIDKGVTVCIENLPIIGNQGNEYDSLFVFPEDFAKFNFQRIKIVWDLGHWAYTCQILSMLQNFSSRVKADKANFRDFLILKDLIAHTHFSSFKGINIPFLNSSYKEGIHPSEGDFSEDTLIKLVQEINGWEKEIGMTLEIQEIDYTNRLNLRKTVDWFEKNIFTAFPK